MQLARFLNKVFKKDGFILVDANSKSYIIGNPKKENPIKLKILSNKLAIPLSISGPLILNKADTKIKKLDTHLIYQLRSCLGVADL